MTARSVSDLAADVEELFKVYALYRDEPFEKRVAARKEFVLALRALVARLKAAEAQVAALTQERDTAWRKAENERRLVDEWTGQAATEREGREAAEAALADTRRALEWIADPSYVGNYSDTDVIAIYRAWASHALAAKVGGTQDSGGDPGEVHPSQSHAERQTELNGPSGSPTSPPERDTGQEQQP